MTQPPQVTGNRYHVFLRDLELTASIGVYAHEEQKTQRIRVNIDLTLQHDPASAQNRAAGREDLSEVLDYQRVARTVRSLIRNGHVKLVETLVERLATACLSLDPRITSAYVKVEKLDVFPDAHSAGVAIQIER